MTPLRGRGARTLLLTSACWILFPAGDLLAQDLGNNCDFRSFRVLNSRAIAIGQRLTWIGQPELVCEGGVEIQADSAVVWEAAGRTEFIGQFRYQDPERELESDSADYFEREGRLFARGQVRMISRNGGPQVRGDTLNLYENGETPADDRMVVSGRPAFALVSPSDSAESSAGSPPYEVTAAQLRFEGERFFYAEGEVEIDRDSLHASSRSLSFDRTLGNLILVGDARVESGGAEFRGRTIFLTLPDDELTSMTLEEDGELRTNDLELFGEEVQIEFGEDQMQRLLAIRSPDAATVMPDSVPPTSPEGVEATEVAADEGSPRPEAYTEGFLLTADSIEVLAPDGVLETVHANGTARAEAHGGEAEVAPDEVSVDETTVAAADGASIDADSVGFDFGTLSRDWIEGDAIVATFIPVTDSVRTALSDEAVPDEEVSPGGTSPDAAEAEAEYVLDRLVAVGSARTLYRSPPEDQAVSPTDEPLPPRDEWAISYLLADQIILTLVGGQVQQVHAEGAVSGLQLEREQPPATEETPQDETAEREVNP